MDDVLQMAAAERSDLADLLETLTPQQWAASSLCTGWTVRDVAAHVVSWEGEPRWVALRHVVHARGRLGRINDVALEPFRELTPADIVERFRSHLVPSGTTEAMGGMVGLVDALIHHQDIRRPLGLPREVPEDRLLRSLRFARFAPPVRGFWHTRGVRVVADDVDFAFGRGPEARGPGEAVLMTLSGRPGAATDLTGPGADVLRDRLG